MNCAPRVLQRVSVVVAIAIAGIPNVAPAQAPSALSVAIVGHTDNVGTLEHNLLLSERRVKDQEMEPHLRWE